MPILASGPSAEVGEDSAIITWTLDTAGPPGYHRTRHRISGTSEWSVSAWSEAASYSAEETISGLDPGDYEYQVDSAARSDGLWTMGWNPASPDAFTIEEAASLELTGLDFSVTKNSITISYSASEPVKCQIFGRVNGGFPPLFSDWITLSSEHSTHSHTKTGLNSSTTYDIRIYITTDEGLSLYSPSETGYHMVATADEGGSGGGYIDTV